MSDIGAALERRVSEGYYAENVFKKMGRCYICSHNHGKRLKCGAAVCPSCAKSYGIALDVEQKATPAADELEEQIRKSLDDAQSAWDFRVAGYAGGA